MYLGVTDNFSGSLSQLPKRIQNYGQNLKWESEGNSPHTATHYGWRAVSRLPQRAQPQYRLFVSISC